MPKSVVLKFAKAYDTLLTQVRTTLINGQRRVEEEKVRTYWQTGQLIHKHFLKYSDRAEYGAEVFKNLSSDLNTEISVLQCCVQFAKAYPKLPNSGGRRNFTWSHYIKLITIPDERSRLRFEDAAQRNAWSAEELALRIRKEKGEAAPSDEEPQPKAATVSRELLKPLRGELYTYQIVKRPTLGPNDEEGVLLDAGFRRFGEIEARVLAQFKVGDIVESKQKENGYRLSLTGRTAKDLYTYAAYIEKVVDGDTLKVRFDLGFGWWGTETLRLRGLDCPEMDTKEGQAAKAFVQSYIKEADLVIVRSSRSDKYDRYLADVFIPQVTNPKTLTPNPDLFLNNMLLENGYARRYEI